MKKETRASVEAELKRIAEIEDKFKALGKLLYHCYHDDKDHNFCLIMQEFERDLNNLNKKEVKQ